MKKSINSLFEEAKNNEAVLEELTKVLLKRGHQAVQTITSKNNLICTPMVDEEGYILEVINYIYGHYQSTKKSFEEYAIYVLYKRLTSMVVNACSSYGRMVDSLDLFLEDGTSIYELIPASDSSSIPDEISLEELHLKMSSPKPTDRERDRLKRKVYLLKNAGFSTNEIKKHLNISENQYRYLLELINADLKDLENHIELK